MPSAQDSPSADDASLGGVRPTPPTLVVGVGASAGGLEALQAMVSGIESGSRACFVVAQHLAPDHASLMAGLLQVDTDLVVEPATDGMLLRPDLIAIAPPGHDVTVTRDAIVVTPAESRTGPIPSVDLLLHSIADSQAERGAGVILSGTGTDGAHGLRAIGDAGGLTVVQTPETCEFNGMPRAALALGGVDVVAPPDQIGPHLRHLAFVDRVTPWTDNDSETQDALFYILAALERASGIDFSNYRTTTLRRQISRRMVSRRISDLNDYRALLESEPAETELLVSCILVPVTQFFRDPEAFAALQGQLERYLASRSADEPLRMWVSGCSTGEEVYSLIMIASEALGRPAELKRRLHVFATDVSERSLAVARRAEYPPDVANFIPTELRARYTMASVSGVRMSHELRDCVVFATHNVIEDPPLSRMDLVSFRNVLIYFNPALQARALDMLSMAQRPESLLFIGESEGVPASVTAYEPLDQDHGIYARTTVRGRGMAPRVPVSAWVPDTATGSTGSSLIDEVTNGYVDVLESFVRQVAGPSLLLSGDRSLVAVVGDVTAYCALPEGQATPDAITLLRPELRTEARTLLTLVGNQATSALSEPVPLDSGDADPVRIRARSLSLGGASLFALSFESDPDFDASPSVVADSDAVERLAYQLDQAERELLITRTSLSRSLEEREAANEEMQATMEELRGVAEELQASHEELEATNNELQSSFAELAAVNDQLRWHGEQLQALNDDLESVQAAANQGMVLVDDELRVTRYTSLAVRLFALVDTDIGQPLVSVPTTMSVEGLGDALADVVSGGPRHTLEASGHGLTFMIQVMPYLGGAQRHRGALVTLTDISESARLRKTAEEALDSLQELTADLEHRAHFDSLTGLLNRESVQELVTREAARALRHDDVLAVVWMDLDGFKEVNDQHGHDAGDIVLATIADRLRSGIRRDDAAGRLGGDEFVLVFPSCGTQAELESLLERVLSSVRQPITLDVGVVGVSASLGVALLPEDGSDADTLMRASDAAMYIAKSAGGDRFAYYQGWMNDEALRRRELRGEVATAITERRFVLRHQPIVNIDGSVWGAQALLAWERDGSLMGPDEFNGFCEETGQIRQLGLLALERLVEDRRSLTEAGLSQLTSSLTLSLSQLDFAPFADELLARASVGELANVMLMVPDSVLRPAHDRALTALTRIREHGVTIAIDDRGAGFAQPRRLRELAPDVITLDRELMGGAATDRVLLQSSVNVSQAIGATVLAAGVDDEAALGEVNELGVTLQEGNAIAPAMSLAGLIAWVSTEDRRSR